MKRNFVKRNFVKRNMVFERPSALEGLFYGVMVFEWAWVVGLSVASGFKFGVELLSEEDGAGEVVFPGLLAGDFAGGLASVED